MLGEGFLRVLPYRDERWMVSSTKPQRALAQPLCEDLVNTSLSTLDSQLSVEPDQKEEESDSTLRMGLGLASRPVLAFSIPCCSSVHPFEPPLSVGLVSCSLLQQYPDLRLMVEAQEPDDASPLRSTDPGYPALSRHPHHSTNSDLWKPQQELGSHLNDQESLVRGTSVTTGLGLTGLGIEPMSNSLLNGLLEKQLDEVYLQHLTDSLARCNSQLEPSLLRGLALPLQPVGGPDGPDGPDSLEVVLQQRPAGDCRKVINYLSVQNTAPCSSNFSSPVLRISESENTAMPRGHDPTA